MQYCFYWIACIFTLVYMKWSEGRTTLFGFKSAAYHRREARRARAEASSNGDYETKTPSLEDGESNKKDEVETPFEENRQFASHI